MKPFINAVIVVSCVLVGGYTMQTRAGDSNSIFDKQIPQKKRVTSGEKNTGRNAMDWLFRHTCPQIMKGKANPEEVKESDYQTVIGKLYAARHLYPSVLDELKTKKYFQGLLKRVKATSAEGYLKQCTRVAHEYATGKNAKDKPLSDVCLGERYPVWINLDLIEKYYEQWKEWKETGKGRKPLVFRSRQCLEWARRAMNINELVAHDEALDLKVLSGKPDETTLRKILSPSVGAKQCDTNDEFKDAFKEIDPKNKDSVFSRREKQVLEMEKLAGIEYAGVRVWYTGRKNAFKNKRNKILYRLTKDIEIRGKKLKAGTLLEKLSDKF
ncbi:MAG: hypothetical protein JRJ19_02665 [Deltaproteobacteria bacterium]|nr:hypothetical protein [Deltaproteobacteria bacterium]